MAEKKIQEGEGAVESITTATPANADKTSAPVDNDAKANQPPVRTNRPNVPIAQVLAAGAGAHEPPDDPHIGADGRWYAERRRREGVPGGRKAEREQVAPRGARGGRLSSRSPPTPPSPIPMRILLTSEYDEAEGHASGDAAKSPKRKRNG